ncbi:hypothetical protein BJX70DRAFT_396028 [Aspergillus crustosus]
MSSYHENAGNTRPVPPIPTRSPTPNLRSGGERRRPVDEVDSTFQNVTMSSLPSTVDPASNPSSHRAALLSDLERQLRESQRELSEQKSLLQIARLDLQNKQQESDHLRKQWRESVNELNRFMRQSQGYNPLTDEELTQKVKQLRLAIRDFTVVHFEQDIRDPRHFQSSVKFIRTYLKVPRSTLEPYFQSGPTRAILLKAFMWAYLDREIFGQFRWAPKKPAKAITVIRDFLEPLREHESDEIPQAQRRLQDWVASTSALVLDVLNLEERASDHRRDLLKDESRFLAKYLTPLSLSKISVFEDDLCDILNRSLDLDEEIGKHLASFTWSYPRAELPCRFDSTIMELGNSHEQVTKSHEVQLVLAPGLDKRGKSSGDRFDQVNPLLKMEVTCEVLPSLESGDILRSSVNPAGWFRSWS